MPNEDAEVVEFCDPLTVQISSGVAEIFAPTAKSHLRIPLESMGPLSKLIAKGSTPIGEIGNYLPSGVIDSLLEAGFLCRPPQAKSSCPWNAWGNLAWAAYNQTRDTSFIRKNTVAMTKWRMALSESQVPGKSPLQLRLRNAPKIWLPRYESEPEGSFGTVLRERRTHRDFTTSPVTAGQLSTILRYAFGPLLFVDAKELGVMELRAPVSSGARHETFACVTILNVTGVESGLYLYDHFETALTKIGECPSRSALESWTGGQGFYESAPVGIFSVADTAKMAWKYQASRAFRHMQQNVGAYTQVLSMVSHSLELGAAITGAINESLVESGLGLSTPREMPMFAFAIGHPRHGERGLPLSLTPQSVSKLRAGSRVL